jgi:hypothetical protein
MERLFALITPPPTPLFDVPKAALGWDDAADGVTSLGDGPDTVVAPAPHELHRVRWGYWHEPTEPPSVA